MEKEKFEKIIRDLEVRVAICEKRLERTTNFKRRSFISSAKGFYRIKKLLSRRTR